jgi:hypothetical protein
MEEEIKKMDQMLKQLQEDFLSKDEKDKIKKIEDEYDNLEFDSFVFDE